MRSDLAIETEILRDHLTSIKGWIEHWKEDAERNFAPTKAGLDAAMYRVTSSLKAIERLSKEDA